MRNERHEPQDSISCQWKYLTKFGEAKREDIDNLLMDKLSDAMDDEQKRNFIMTLLQEMRREKIVAAKGGKRDKGAVWQLHKAATKDEI